jgi:hypothetical protein
MMGAAAFSGKSVAAWPDQTIYIGAYTRANQVIQTGRGIVTGRAGGKVTAFSITSGDPSNHFDTSVSGGGRGNLYPNATGEDNLSGTYTLSMSVTDDVGVDTFTLTVIIEDNVAHVHSGSGLEAAILAAGSNDATGWTPKPITIKLRPGNYSGFDVTNCFKNKYWSDGNMRFESADVYNQAVFVDEEVDINSASGMRFRNLKFRADDAGQNFEGYQLFSIRDAAAGDVANIYVDDCEFRGIYYDPSTDQSANSTATCGGIRHGTSTNIDHIHIRRCLVEDVNAGISLSWHGNSENIDNLIRRCFSDGMSGGSTSMTTFNISRNIISQLHYTGGGVHPDYWQWIEGSSYMTGMTVSLNRLFPGNALEYDPQCFFTNGDLQDVEWRANFIVNANSKGIRVEAVNGMKCFYNTIIQIDPKEANANGLYGRIDCGVDASGEVPHGEGAGTFVNWGNIVPVASTKHSSVTNDADNWEIVLGADTDGSVYAGVFDTLAANFPDTFAEGDHVTYYSMKVGGNADDSVTLEKYDAGAVGSGYVTDWPVALGDYSNYGVNSAMES